MLVLTRRPGEQIMIVLPTGELITVTLTEVMGQDVRLGVNAPRQIAVHRGEVADKIACGRIADGQKWPEVPAGR
jgi:carbon storage regulator